MKMYFWVCIALAYSKSLESHILLTDLEPWQPLTNFGLDVGTGNYTFRARLASPLPDQSSTVTIKLALYLGVEWNEKVYSALTCEQKLKFAKKVSDVTLYGNAEWSFPNLGKLTQKVRPHVWHFVLADCERSTSSRKIRYEFSIVNPENSHFSVEMKGLKSINCILLILLVLSLGKNIYRMCKFDDEEEIQGPVIWVNLSIFTQIMGVAFNFAHLCVYDYDGEGVTVFEFFGEAFTIISNLAITVLLIIIAGGWTLTHSEFPLPELYIPAMFLLTFLHLFMAGFNFLHEREKHSFSRYEGTSGFVIILLRIAMYMWFLWNLYKTAKEKTLKKSWFIYRFGLGASLYFLAVPLLVIGSSVFPTYLREKIVVAGGNFFQAAAFYILYYIFTGKGEYHKANSVLNMLPGFKSAVD